MKKVLLIITLLEIVIASNSYNYPIVNTCNSAYTYKTMEIMYDSKKRPHKIIIYKALNSGYNRISIAAIDLDAGTYINK